MDNKKYCVYMHTAPNGKVYIGITSQKPSQRFGRGRGYWHNKKTCGGYIWRYAEEVM